MFRWRLNTKIPIKFPLFCVLSVLMTGELVCHVSCVYGHTSIYLGFAHPSVKHCCIFITWKRETYSTYAIYTEINLYNVKMSMCTMVSIVVIIDGFCTVMRLSVSGLVSPVVPKWWEINMLLYTWCLHGVSILKC